ncbi:translocase inner membrane subunit 44-1 [Arabidopsis thaliana]|uniref:Mitochondrial import inner membrane translocase subunit TIM44-1 n=2 Tax=Arabidopsis thaliana TaxID=3702 RepID=TI441_ARATH|nr:translocase inner membrane subunit 44-1 [Arabidopsis thaliana]Q1PF33.1 RecName: Full=Mitochondrial import inner membrane translocase subunit TIM44-1; Flags: Precursor [Arabidopsis thaliana]ABE65836.1 mitochondrial import inner membrane translocase subunit TIM44 [Arabidopsis thaliana]ANM63221.1 translocase inner membrane subunit 44-1 [Arabidopsis thaliana]|eukprot:NP_001325325.1 translocase inner membrane subunit 44-1 [Arabidopsis thaliana]
MAIRKIIRDLLITKQPLLRQLFHQRVLRANARSEFLPAIGYTSHRRFSVFTEFSKNIRGEAHSNPEFERTVKELKERTEEFKGVTEDLKVRTKQTTEKLYKQADGVWTEAESAAKKVSSSVKDKLSAASEEVKESFKLGKEENAESASSSGTRASQGEKQQSGSTEELHTFFAKFKSSLSSPKVSEVFYRLKEAKPFDIVKQALDIVKDELRGNPSRKKFLEHTPPPPFTGERSMRTEMVVTQTKQSKLQQKWESFREKMQGSPVFKRLSGMSEPVVNKSQEIAEDVREIWETSDNPIVHKIQDMNEKFLKETDSASTYKEIRSRDPSFSLPDFAAEIEEVIKPVLNAYSEGDVETLKKYCSKEVIERCTAERTAYQTHGVLFDNKLLHISEVSVSVTKMMGDSPIIIAKFQTQEIYCVRDENGEIQEGGQDTIHTVYHEWAMQQVETTELGEDAIYPIWRLREMCRNGVQALI